jgi:small-conductance mechanosensitive channel
MRGLRLLLFVLLAALFAPAGLSVVPLAGAAMAQEAPAAPDYPQWEKDAALAEQVLEQDRASNQALEQLRQRIVDWRARFAAVQSANQQRIETLRSQIAALGAAPAEGQSEAPEIAARRSELNGQLAKLEAPGIAAVEAHSRAEGIIREIDTLIRDRQADALLKLSPSPVNPINWPAGAAVLTQGLKTLWSETVGAWNNPARRTELRNNLPVIILYIAIAGILVLRAPGFIGNMTARLQRSSSMRTRALAATILSLGQVVVPVLGVLLLVMATKATGMTGLRSGELIGALPEAAAAFFLARWLGASVFTGGTTAPIVVERPAEARFHASMLGVAAALEVMRVAFATDVRPPLSQAAQSVWAFPVAVLVAVFLFRLGHLIRRREGTLDTDERAFGARIQKLFGTALVAASVVSPLLGVVGYVAAANALIWPALGTLALVGLVIVLHRFLTDIYLVVSRSGEEGREALVPVLLGFVLALTALPALALIWGARTADLWEAWNRFRGGIVLGETRISPTSFLTLVAVFVMGYLATRLVQGALKYSVLPRTNLEKGVQNALAAGVGYVGIFLAALVSITAAGLDLSSLAIVAGALSVGIGFGLQNIVQNFVSGIILLIERPISEGDMIEVNGQFGIVKGISVRSTWIETFDRTDVIVPNGDLVAGVVTNLTRGNLTGRLILKAGVAYGSDTRRVEAILKEIANAQPLVLVDPAPAVIFTDLGADSLNFEVRAILSDVNFKNVVLSEMNHEIVRRFAEEGIEIPFVQRDIWIRNPEALRGEARAAAAPAPATPAEPAARRTPDPRLIHNDPSEDDPDR